jgi:hypothetical protein
MAKRPKLEEKEVAKLTWLIARVRAGASLAEITETLRRCRRHWNERRKLQ